MCKYYKTLTEKQMIPDENGNFYEEDVPYADECIRYGEKKAVLCPDCLSCDLMKEEASEFIESMVHTR